MGNHLKSTGERVNAALRPGPGVVGKLVWAGECLVVAAVLAALASLLPAPWPHHAAPHPTRPDMTFRVLDPKDGTLTVADVSVHQLTGRCPKSGVCEYTAPAQTPLVKVTAATKAVPLHAGHSTSFSVSVSPMSPSIDPARVRVSATNGTLSLDQMQPGTYRLTLKGTKGAWQFDLQVLGKAR